MEAFPQLQVEQNELTRKENEVEADRVREEEGRDRLNELLELDSVQQLFVDEELLKECQTLMDQGKYASAVLRIEKALVKQEENKAKVTYGELAKGQEVEQLFAANEELHREVLELAEEG